MSTTVIVIIVIASVAFVAGTGIFICCTISSSSHKLKLKTPRLNTANRKRQFVRSLRPSLAQKGALPRPKSAGEVEGAGRRSPMQETPRRVSEISISYHQRMELMHRVAMATIREDEPDVGSEGEFRETPEVETRSSRDMRELEVDREQICRDTREKEVDKDTIWLMADGQEVEQYKNFTESNKPEVDHDIGCRQSDEPEVEVGISCAVSRTAVPPTVLTLESETQKNEAIREGRNSHTARNLKTATDNNSEMTSTSGFNSEMTSTSGFNSHSANRVDLFTTSNTRSSANRTESTTLPEITSSRINLVASAASVGNKRDNSKSKTQRLSSRRKRNRVAIDPDIVKQNKNELNSYHNT